LRVEFSAPSRQDLIDITLQIARDKPQRAKSYAVELRAACRSLQDHPRRFPVAVNTTEPLRRFVHGPYLVFYAVRSDHTRIVRILHGARQITPDLLA
jgi:toxin ParE1/3/4